MANESFFNKCYGRIISFRSFLPNISSQGNKNLSPVILDYSSSGSPVINLIESNYPPIIELYDVKGDKEMIAYLRSALGRSGMEKANLQMKLDNEISQRKSLSARIFELESKLFEAKHQLEYFTENEKKIDQKKRKEMDRKSLESRLEFVETLHVEEEKSLFKTIEDLQEELARARSQNLDDSIDLKMERLQSETEIKRMHHIIEPLATTLKLMK